MSNQSSIGQTITGIVCLLVVFGFIKCMVCSDGGTPSEPAAPKAAHDSIGAWVMCEAFVKDRLKSPASADFGGVFSGDYQDPNTHAVHLGDGKYKCNGFVDSQNSFGGTVRSNFQLTVQHKGGDKWRLVAGPVIQ